MDIILKNKKENKKYRFISNNKNWYIRVIKNGNENKSVFSVEGNFEIDCKGNKFDY